MISVSKLLFNDDYFGDALRFNSRSREAKHGTTPGIGPVVVWNMTKTCNLRCVHCYMDSDSQKYQGELTTEEGKRFIDDLVDFRVPVLLFSGGEPLIREDLFELAEYAIKRGIRVTLSTNGTLITAAVAHRLKRIGVGYVGISLDGIDGVNDKFRGKDGAFKSARQGIKNCVEASQRVGLRFTINRHNYEELEKIFDFIESENIDRACFYHLVYSGRGNKLINQDITREETRKAMDIIIRRTKDYAARGLQKEILTVDNHSDGIYLYLQTLKHDKVKAERIKELIYMSGGNRSGIALAEVDPFGNVHPDQFTQHITFGNVKERKFADIWTDMTHPILAGLKNRQELLKGRCKNCRYLDFCNGNFRTRAEALTGDFWEADPACYLTDKEIGGR